MSSTTHYNLHSKIQMMNNVNQLCQHAKEHEKKEIYETVIHDYILHNWQDPG